MEEIVQNEFTCAICLDVLKQPKSLLCGHNLCGTCLQSYLHTENKNCPGRKHIICPQCRETTPIPDPSKPVSEWWNQFKTNWSIQNIIEGLNKKPNNPDCDICRSEGREVEAHHLCRTCNLLFCGRCQIVHRQIPACSQHDVKDTGAGPGPPKKIFEFRVHLDSSTSSRKRKQHSVNLKKQLKRRIAVLCRRVADSLKEKEEQLNKQVDVIVDEVFERLVSDHVIWSLSEDQEAVGRSSESLSEDQGAVGRSSESLSEDQGAVGRSSESSLPVPSFSADRYGGASHGSHRFFTIIRLTSNVEPFVQSKYTEVVGKLEHKVDFKAEDNTSLKQVAGSLSIGLYDNVEVEQIDIPPVDKESSSSSDEGDEFIPVYECTIQSKVAEDNNDPWIRDISIMDASDFETVVVTDFNNSCVKSFYNSATFPAEYECSRLVLQGKPWGVTEIQNERVAVTVPNRKIICIIRVNPKLKIVSDIKASKAFYGIARIDSTTLVASAPKEETPGVVIIDFNGRILKIITTDARKRNIFEAPYAIAVSSYGDIMVADEKSKKVIFVTKDGLIMARDKSKKSYRPRTLYGIAGDSSGNLYLVDRDEFKIVLVSEGEDDEIFLSQKDHGINFPRCVGLYKDDSLYVAEEGGAIKKFLLLDK